MNSFFNLMAFFNLRIAVDVFALFALQSVDIDVIRGQVTFMVVSSLSNGLQTGTKTHCQYIR